MVPTDEVRVGIVGSGQIAGAHSAAYRTVAGTYPEAPRAVALTAVADLDQERADALARAWGWTRAEADWRAITRADDVDLVDICVPNALHAEIAIDALAHGKHVVCEKPLASDWSSARAMVQAAAAADRVAQVCFYYRVWPAVSWAAELVSSGRLGRPRHFRGWMLQDYAANPAHDLAWRARIGESGAGALGDLGSHIIDLARSLCGDITQVCGTLNTLVDRGPSAAGIDDLAAMLVRFEDGTSGVLEASWALRGHHCDLGFDLVCEHGGVRFSWERFNEVQVLEGDTADPTNGYRVVHIGKGQPDVDRFVSVPGQGMGYRDTFTIGVLAGPDRHRRRAVRSRAVVRRRACRGTRGRRHAALSPRRWMGRRGPSRRGRSRRRVDPAVRGASRRSGGRLGCWRCGRVGCLPIRSGDRRGIRSVGRRGGRVRGGGLLLGRGHADLGGGVGALRPAAAADDRQQAQQLHRLLVLLRGPGDDHTVGDHPADDLFAELGADDGQRPVVVLADAAGGDVGVLGGEVGAALAALPGPVRGTP